MTTPQPSPRTYPFAEASKVLHRLSFERKPAALRDSVTMSDSSRLTPPTIAMVQSPDRIDAIAR